MQKPTTGQVVRYRFDNFMAKGSKSIFISLTVVFLAVLGFLSLVRGAVMFLAPDKSQYAGTFTDNKTITIFIKWTRGLLGVFIVVT